MMRSNSDSMARFKADLIDVIPALRAFARQMTRNNVNEADDLVQETLVRALDAYEQFRPGTSLKSWTFTILRRIRGMQLRRTGLGVSFEPIDEGLAERDRSFAVAPRQEAALSVDDLERAMERLPEEQRVVLALICGAGCSYEEAAQIMGCEIGTIKSRLHRARRSLETMLLGTSRKTLRRRSVVPPPSANYPRHVGVVPTARVPAESIAFAA